MPRKGQGGYQRDAELRKGHGNFERDAEPRKGHGNCERDAEPPKGHGNCERDAAEAGLCRREHRAGALSTSSSNPTKGVEQGAELCLVTEAPWKGEIAQAKGEGGYRLDSAQA